jgi:tRNA A37 N6-isopentenylltransferase MiaA
MLFDDKIFTHINLNPNREELYKNCNLRFELMLKNGAIDEEKSLINHVSKSHQD